MVEVKSVRCANVDWGDPRNIYVGRGAQQDLYGLKLGNPYTMRGEWDRDRVCDLVRNDVDEALRTRSSALWEALCDLNLALIAQGELVLWCWCAPRRCHADEYVRALRVLEEEAHVWEDAH